MSLTNDMTKLKEAADKLAAARQGQEICVPASIAEKSEDSYYEKRTKDSNDAKRVLQEYGFDNPVELKNMLQTMWIGMDKEEMCAFIPVSTVASAKNKPQKEAQANSYVSPYIYEF